MTAAAGLVSKHERCKVIGLVGWINKFQMTEQTSVLGSSHAQIDLLNGQSERYPAASKGDIATFTRRIVSVKVITITIVISVQSAILTG
jgi:hypothetical protein